MYYVTVTEIVEATDTNTAYLTYGQRNCFFTQMDAFRYAMSHGPIKRVLIESDEQVLQKTKEERIKEGNYSNTEQ